MSERNIPRSEDPLTYWGNRKTSYQNLFHLALQFLCTPASSVPVSFPKLGKWCQKNAIDWMQKHWINLFFWIEFYNKLWVKWVILHSQYFHFNFHLVSFTIYFIDVYNIWNVKDIKWFHGKYNTLQCTSMTRSLNQCLLWVSSKLPAMIFKVQQVSVWSKTATLCRHSIDTVWGMCWNASRGLIYPSLLVSNFQAGGGGAVGYILGTHWGPS